MKLKNKQSLIAILVLFLVIGVTIAYFQSSASFENIFNTGTYKVVTTEVFESPDNWKPGEEIPKTITTKNEGTIPAAVRVSYTEKWDDKNGTDITTSIPEGAVVINLDNTSDWTKEGNYYYYNYILNPNKTTSSFIKSVTLNAQLGSGDDIDCTPSQDGKSVTCEATDPLYGAKYKLTLTKETVQADKYQEVWNTQVNIIEKPSALAIGTDVDYVTSLNGVTLDDWKVFYSDSNYTYLILGDYMPNTAVIGVIPDIYTSAVRQSYGSIYGSNGNRTNLINAMTIKSNWTQLLKGVINETSIDYTETTDSNIYAVGSPTLELWIDSWNKVYPDDRLYTAYKNNMSDGYNGNYIGINENPSTTNVNNSTKTGYSNELYYPHTSIWNSTHGYWLASPGTSTSYVIGVNANGEIHNSLSGFDYYESNDYAFRPVIKLPTSVVNQ